MQGPKGAAEMSQEDLSTALSALERLQVRRARGGACAGMCCWLAAAARAAAPHTTPRAKSRVALCSSDQPQGPPSPVGACSPLLLLTHSSHLILCQPHRQASGALQERERPAISKLARWLAARAAPDSLLGDASGSGALQPDGCSCSGQGAAQPERVRQLLNKVRPGCAGACMGDRNGGCSRAMIRQ